MISKTQIANQTKLIGLRQKSSRQIQKELVWFIFLFFYSDFHFYFWINLKLNNLISLVLYLLKSLISSFTLLLLFNLIIYLFKKFIWLFNLFKMIDFDNNLTIKFLIQFSSISHHLTFIWFIQSKHIFLFYFYSIFFFLFYFSSK